MSVFTNVRTKLWRNFNKVSSKNTCNEDTFSTWETLFRPIYKFSFLNLWTDFETESLSSIISFISRVSWYPHRNTKHHKGGWLKLYLNTHRHTELYFSLYLELNLDCRNFLDLLAHFLFIQDSINNYGINEHHCHFILKCTNEFYKNMTVR